MIREKVARAVPGFLMVLVTLVGIGVDVWLFVRASQAQDASGLVSAIVLLVAVILILPGFAIVMPGEAKVITLFGSYSGTVTGPGSGG